MTKKCTTCGQTKDYDDFYIDRNKGKARYCCKACDKLRLKSEESKARRRAWYHKNKSKT